MTKILVNTGNGKISAIEDLSWLTKPTIIRGKTDVSIRMLWVLWEINII